MTITIGLFASAMLVSVALALGSYLGLLIRDLAADKAALETSEDTED